MKKSLTIFLSASLALLPRTIQAETKSKRGQLKLADASGEGGGEALRTLTPGDCQDPLIPCYCYRHESVRLIAAELMNCDAMAFELEQYQRLAEIKAQSPWYDDQTFVIGGVVVSLSLGVVLGWYLSSQ